MNDKLTLYPQKRDFVKLSDLEEKDRIFTFAIGSNNNKNDWMDFLDKNINKALISRKKTVTSDNIQNFKQCLKFVDEGVLNNHYLSFSSYSYKRGGMGIATLGECKGCQLRGCIFELVADDTIKKKHIINLIRWKEDFPKLYKEVILSVKTKGGKSYNCLIYVINTATKIKNINKTFPAIPIPPSLDYIRLILLSHNEYNFRKSWKNTIKEILNRTKEHGIEFNKNIKKLYDIYSVAYNKPRYKLIKYIEKNYNNVEFRSFRQAKDNKNEYELFKIYVLLSCQCVIYASQNGMKEKNILNIIKALDEEEYVALINIINGLLSWDNIIKQLQQ
tara:strand:- start:263 stop:1258 length:996 start_codon:yes stop_codon:yes gene_type:complete